MEAKVSLTVTPIEFDLVRDAIERASESNLRIAQDSSIEARVRSESRTKHVQYADLLKKLGR